jgi:hypothetical protein
MVQAVVTVVASSAAVVEVAADVGAGVKTLIVSITTVDGRMLSFLFIAVRGGLWMNHLYISITGERIQKRAGSVCVFVDKRYVCRLVVGEVGMVWWVVWCFVGCDDGENF